MNGNEDRPHVVHRAFGRGDVLLYVGVTVNLDRCLGRRS